MCSCNLSFQNFLRQRFTRNIPSKNIALEQFPHPKKREKLHLSIFVATPESFLKQRLPILGHLKLALHHRTMPDPSSDFQLLFVHLLQGGYSNLLCLARFFSVWSHTARIFVSEWFQVMLPKYIQQGNTFIIYIYNPQLHSLLPLHIRIG